MSKIEWTDRTWNPVIGCSEISPGCTNCYAARMAHRLAGMPHTKERYQGLTKRIGEKQRIVWNGELRTVWDVMLEPANRTIPTKYFVGSMTDLFHSLVEFETLATIFAVMALCPQHTFQVLTKRPHRAVEFFDWADKYRKIDRMAEGILHANPDLFYEKELIINQSGDYLKAPGANVKKHLLKSGWGFNMERSVNYDYYGRRPYPHIWIGTSIEDNDREGRIANLLEIPAAVRFLSCEPLLGAVTLPVDCSDGSGFVDWVIAGGESGPGARPCHPDWIRSLRDQCAQMRTPFFFKQWGEYLPISQASEVLYGPMSDEVADKALRQVKGPHDNFYYKLGKKLAGHRLDGVEHLEFPQTPIL